MNSVLFFLDLRIKRLSTVMWLAAVIALVLMYVALYPSIKSTPGVDEFIQNLPEALREAFAIADYSSPTGYLQAEIFSGLLPVVLLVLVIGRGSASVAGEEDQKRLEIVMAQPVS
ncbi:MAG TPA: ABC transporter permease, partial [Actinobacteria bacterium]|nr:ABC transporter permease [Actinomycetota bacterium]